MNALYLLFNVLGWAACLSVFVWAVGYGIYQWRGQWRGHRLASDRAFDRMVEEYRRQQRDRV